MPAPVKRSYDASRRHAQSQDMRRHIIETAQPLFLTLGYEATSMRHLADAAGVSLQTLYNAFESKFGVFSAVMDVIVAGDDEPVAMADRPAIRALAAIDDPAALVRAVVDVTLPILARLDVIYPTLRAATSDPQVAEAFQRFAVDARYEHHRAIGLRLEQLGALPPSISARAAADISWTVLSPDTYHLLVDLRGWSQTAFATWATESLLAALVARPAPAPRSRRR
jgi:AcrR family transcriptional regulator